VFWAISEVLKERQRWRDALAAAREEGRESRDEELRKQLAETGEIVVDGKRLRVMIEGGAASGGNGNPAGQR